MNVRSLANMQEKIYTSNDKVTVDGLTEKSLFSPSYTGRGLLIPKLTLRVGDVYLIKMNGLFTTATGAQSILKVYFGNLIVSQNTTYSLNRTNYYIEQELILTVRAVGTNGSLIYQGRTIIQNDNQYNVSVGPITTTAHVTIDTTIDNVINETFQWTAPNNSIIVSNAYIRKY